MADLAGNRNAYSMKIERIEIFPVEYPARMYFKFFTTPMGASGRPSVVIKITTDTGMVGWGQSVPISTWNYETMESSMVVLKNYYIPALLGSDPLDITAAHAAMDKVIRPSFSTGMPLTRAGMDIALHDLAGKAAGLPIAGLWGKKQRGTLEMSWTVNVTKIEDVALSVTEGQKSGYRHFNVKVAPDPDFDCEVLKIVRALAPDAFLWVDANGGYELDTALKAAPMLADLGVRVLESPLPPNRISGYQQLRRQGAVPIFMDEGVISPVELEEFIKLGMLDGLAMKPARCGGLLSNKRQIEICRDHGLGWVGSGLSDPDISLAASLALYDAYELDVAAALNGPQFLNGTILCEPIRIESAIARVPDGPGLGIEVDENLLREMSERTAREWKMT